MKINLFLLVFILFYSCNKPVPVPSKKNYSKDTLSIIDNNSFDNVYIMKNDTPFRMGGMGMTYSILYKGKKIVDTIDATVGFEYVGKDSIVYLPVKIWNDDYEGVVGNIKNYILLTKEKRIIIKEILPYFNDYFSSPIIKDGKIYYWGIKYMSDESGIQDLYAMRYDFKMSQLDSIFLKNYLQEGTDDMGFYSIITDNNELHFQLWNDGEWIIEMKTFSLKEVQ